MRLSFWKRSCMLRWGYYDAATVKLLGGKLACFVGEGKPQECTDGAPFSLLRAKTAACSMLDDARRNHFQAGFPNCRQKGVMYHENIINNIESVVECTQAVTQFLRLVQSSRGVITWTQVDGLLPWNMCKTTLNSASYSHGAKFMRRGLWAQQIAEVNENPCSALLCLFCFVDQGFALLCFALLCVSLLCLFSFALFGWALLDFYFFMSFLRAYSLSLHSLVHLPALFKTAELLADMLSRLRVGARHGHLHKDGY